MIKRDLTMVQCDIEGCEYMWLPDSDRGYTCFACRCHICLEHACAFSVSACIVPTNLNREKFAELLYLYACEKCMEAVKHALFEGNYSEEAREVIADSLQTALTGMVKATRK